MNLPDFTGDITAEIGEHEAIITTARLQALQLAEKRLRKVATLKGELFGRAHRNRGPTMTIVSKAFADATELAATELANILVST